MIHVWFDGGSKGNGSDNKGYGSFAVFDGDKRVTQITMDADTKDKRVCQDKVVFDWPNSTSQAAEFKTAVMALVYANQLQKRVYFSSGGKLQFVFHGDCENVIGFMQGKRKVNALHLKPIAEKIKAELGVLCDVCKVEIVQEPRENVVKVLGH